MLLLCITIFTYTSQGGNIPNTILSCFHFLPIELADIFLIVQIELYIFTNALHSTDWLYHNLFSSSVDVLLECLQSFACNEYNKNSSLGNNGNKNVITESKKIQF